MGKMICIIVSWIVGLISGFIMLEIFRLPPGELGYETHFNSFIFCFSGAFSLKLNLCHYHSMKKPQFLTHLC